MMVRWPLKLRREVLSFVSPFVRKCVTVMMWPPSGAVPESLKTHHPVPSQHPGKTRSSGRDLLPLAYLLNDPWLQMAFMERICEDC